MISRRSFLLGGTGVALAGGVVAVEVIGPRKVFHELHLMHSPDHDPPASGWPVEERTFASDFMPDAVGWAIAMPPAAPTGFVLCLHGRNSDHHGIFTDHRFHDAVAEAGLDLAVVAVDGGDSSYYHRRADGRDPERMIIEELLALIDAELGSTLPRAVIGWSMGGYGALHLAARHPSIFRAAVAGSPALWHSFAESSPGAFDDEDDFRRNDVFAARARLAGTVVRIDCGTDDGFLGAARDFAAGLANPNPGSFTEGFHEAPYWRSIAAAQLTTISGALA